MRAALRRLAALAVALGLAGAVALAPAPAEAATPAVYVEVVVASTWSAPTRDAVNWVDYYTGSNMVLGSCRAGYKCIIVRERLVSSSWAAVTYSAQGWFSSSDRVWIYLNPQRRGYADWMQRRIIAHEVAHANGVTWHALYCNSIMWRSLYCSNGSLPPWRFTDPMRTRLRAN
jgi:hypothetical protein